MEDVSIPAVLVRWIHIGSVIALVGGALFMRYVLMPAASQLPDEAHSSLRKWETQRWSKFVHPLVGLIVLTGIYNLVVRVRLVEPIWHMLFTVKFLLAMYVLFVASALVGRAKGLQPLRDNAPKFLTINLIIAAIIVLVSSLMKNIPEKEKAAEETSRLYPSSAVVLPVATSNSASNGTSNAKTANV